MCQACSAILCWGIEWNCHLFRSFLVRKDLLSSWKGRKGARCSAQGNRGRTFNRKELLWHWRPNEQFKLDWRLWHRYAAYSLRKCRKRQLIWHPENHPSDQLPDPSLRQWRFWQRLRRNSRSNVYKGLSLHDLLWQNLWPIVQQVRQESFQRTLHWSRVITSSMQVRQHDRTTYPQPRVILRHHLRRLQGKEDNFDENDRPWHSQTQPPYYLTRSNNLEFLRAAEGSLASKLHWAVRLWAIGSCWQLG